jgi:hypothetical protein
VEWYNLAKRHGWYQFLLHDDFYDEDGSAYQPRTEVDRADEFPAPTLAEVASNAECLLGYSNTRWPIKPEIEAAWTALPRPEVLAVLRRRFSGTSNEGVRGCIMEVCAIALGESGAEFVRGAWRDYPGAIDLTSLIQASAACLPFREAFERATRALEVLEAPEQRQQMSALSYFHSTEVLDWIEQHVCTPVTDEWGRLAAASQLDWPRAERWLKEGRLRSLVALDALVEIARPQTPFLGRYGPKLGQPPDPDQLARALSQYAERDAVPRVQRLTAWLLSHADALTKTDWAP